MDHRGLRKTGFVLLLAAIGGLGAACDRSAPSGAQGAPAPTPTSTPVTTAPAAPAPPSDPEGVPDHGPATSCAAVTGDARAMRARLRTIERGAELTPPETASLLEGCGATARDIARSLEKAGKHIAQARAHDYVAASAYFRRAIEVDPSYVSARVSLAGVRGRTGDVDGALYQLDQVRGAGAEGTRAIARIYGDGRLASLRLRPRFWEWAGNPRPEMLGTLPGATEAELASIGTSISFTPPIDVPDDVVFANLSLESVHYRTIAASVGAVLGERLGHVRGVQRDALVSPWIDGLDAFGASLVTRMSAFRFGDGEVVLALPIMAGEEGLQTPLVVIAKGPEAGPFEIVRVVTSTPECGEPVLFTSPDRRVLGFITSCDEGDDPSSFGRCLISGDAGRVVMHCGATAVVAGVVGGGDDEDYADEYVEYD